jgi:hypothetical protein
MVRRVLEDVHVDWSELINTATGPSLERMARLQIRNVIDEVCQLFTLNIAESERTLLESAVRGTDFPFREEVQNLLQRCAMRGISDVDVGGLADSGGYPSPEPSLAVTSERMTSLLPKRIGETEFSSFAEFEHSQHVKSARTFLVQNFKANSVDLSALWENIIGPFSRASRIYLLDPYIIKNHVSGKSGLSYLVRRWGELSQEQGRKMLVSVIAAHGDKDLGTLTKNDLEEVVAELVEIGQVIAVRVRLVNAPRHKKDFHGRHFLAIEGSVACRALTFDDSLHPGSRGEKLQMVALHLHPALIGNVSQEFANLAKKAELDVSFTPSRST